MVDSDYEPAGLSDSDRGIIANALRLGGSLSFAFLAAGLFLRMEAHPLAHSRLGDLLLHAGLVTLLATPVVRILTAIWLYGRAGNRSFALYCIISLTVVAASIGVGFLFRR